MRWSTIVEAMRSTLVALVLCTPATAQPALSESPPPSSALLLGSWQCGVEWIQPSLSAKLLWSVRYDIDGRYTWSGTSTLTAKPFDFNIVFEMGREGSWSLADATLQLLTTTVTMANATQPAGMNEQETAELRQRINEQFEIDAYQRNLLGPSSLTIVALSATRLALRDQDSKDLFECRRADPSTPQAR